MSASNRKRHWDKIYRTKELQELSWYESYPEVSLDFLKQFNVSKEAGIIDIGGGDSLFVDHLLDQGFKDVTVLDISKEAIQRAQNRLGKRAELVTWVVSDITDFNSSRTYDFWHDRAAFHFLTEDNDVDRYVNILQQSLASEGVFILGTFSETGPQMCSGVAIRQYSERTMTQRLRTFFRKIRCVTVDHVTPFNTIQNFIFCSFTRLPVVGS